MKENKVIKNYLFNASYQILALIVPLITTPYISRVLRADGIGLYSFTYSIVSYFTLCAVLGTVKYANKQIGILQDSPIERTKKFLDILSLRFITAGSALILYIGYVIAFADSKLIALVQSFYILDIMFDVSWFFQGMEDFKKIAIRNYIFKILNVAYIFIFVKEYNDLWKYVFGLAFLTWIGSLSIWPSLKKYLVPVKGYKPKPFADIKVIVQLFIPALAVQVYAMLDKSMIGWLTEGKAENGYYEQSEKIVKMCLMLITALIGVTVPKISKLFAENHKEEAVGLIYNSSRFVWFLGVPLTFGIIGISKTLVPVFFGDGFEPVTNTLYVMSLLFISMGLNQTIGSLYYISTGNQNIYTISVVIGGIFNIALNLALIPHFGALGAAIASVCGEIVIMLAEMGYIIHKKIFSITPIFKSSVKYIISGIVMLALLIILEIKLPENVLSLAGMIISGAAVYFICLIILREKFILGIIGSVKNKITSLLKGKLKK